MLETPATQLRSAFFYRPELVNKLLESIRLAALLLFGVFTLSAQELRPQAVAPSTNAHFAIYRKGGEPSSLVELVNAASTATVTFIGEVHDDSVGQ